MEKQVITIYDVANEAKVSMATVSRVVNGNPNVKEDTRKKVMEVIDRLNYRPNAVARGLASKKSTTIGLIIPDMTNLYFASLAKGINDVAAMYKYHIISSTIDPATDEEQVIDNLLSKQVDGLIYMGHSIDKKLKRLLINSKTPVAFAGILDDSNEIASVNIDYTDSMKEVTTRLIQNGHEQIAFVGGDLQTPMDGMFKLEGYKQALEKAGISYSSSLVFEAEYTLTAGAAIWDTISATGATAAVVNDDVLAVGILNAAQDSGVKIPEDFELITSNNTMLCQVTRPKMSSISQPLYDIGAVSMRLLTKLMNQEMIDDNRVTLPYSIVRRETTK
ncbi:catabolite control protein A [Companilactobacillus sp. RD055328]|uniref:catabolite control protein A n=1 Tax=Companilactobacillus sp. RD055328 TaxID=2916634 RepID=UPI001FC80724|nr:catabolite control protein A [Companilactobacillus sp. RD055328]GKQ42088.1 catabolite control protein A [Companilactobacillus sp. RD055328]